MAQLNSVKQLQPSGNKSLDKSNEELLLQDIYSMNILLDELYPLEFSKIQDKLEKEYKKYIGSQKSG